MEILECQLTVRPKQQESQMMINMPVPRAGSVGMPDMEQAPPPNQVLLFYICCLSNYMNITIIMLVKIHMLKFNELPHLL